MVHFGVPGQFVGQLTGHYGLNEIYAHIFASMFLFTMSLIAIAMLFYYYRSSIIKVHGIWNGIFYTGLIGLGEALEHSFSNITIGSMFHYLHLISAPIALLFYYVGIKEIFGKKDKKFSVNQVVFLNFLFFGIVLVSVVILSQFSHTIWDFHVEEPFIILTAIPTMVLVGMVIEKSKVITESTLLLTSLRIVTIGVCFLTLSILIGRHADINKWANIYIIAHQTQNIFHVVIGTALVIMVMTLSQVGKILDTIKHQ